MILLCGLVSLYCPHRFRSLLINMDLKIFLTIISSHFSSIVCGQCVDFHMLVLYEKMSFHLCTPKLYIFASWHRVASFYTLLIVRPAWHQIYLIVLFYIISSYMYVALSPIISSHLSPPIVSSYSFNTMKPRKNGCHCPDYIFKYPFLNTNVLISIKISPQFVRRGPIKDIAALFQIMAWCRTGDMPLSEPMIA